MIKIVTGGSFDFGMPAASLMNLWSGGVDKGYMQKRASNAFCKIAKDIKPEPGHSHIHLISLGAYETYGANRNGDGFNEKRAFFKLAKPKDGLSDQVMLGDGLLKYHSTFTKRGHVFKHHKNDDPKNAIGSIVAEAYNPDMRRGELIIKVANDHPDWSTDLNNLANGKDIPYSMACKIAADLCGICGNRARKKEEYCEHAKDLTSMWKSGHMNFVMNDEPIFFDISKVFRPADRIAYSLQKVASDENVSGLDLAKAAGLEIAPYWLEDDRPAGSSRHYFAKLALAQKLAAIEKTVGAMANGADNTHLSALCKGAPAKCLPQNAMDSMSGHKSEEVLKKLSSAGICLRLPEFFSVVMGKKAKLEFVNEAAANTKDLFSRLAGLSELSKVAAALDYDVSSEVKTAAIDGIVRNLVSAHSLNMDAVTKRAELSVLRQETPTLIKSASTGMSKEAEYLTKEYAKYVLSFVHANAHEDATNELTVLQQYITV